MLLLQALEEQRKNYASNNVCWVIIKRQAQNLYLSSLAHNNLMMQLLHFHFTGKQTESAVME